MNQLIDTEQQKVSPMTPKQCIQYAKTTQNYSRRVILV